MKKLLQIFIITLSVFTLFGCGKKAPAPEPIVEPSIGSTISVDGFDVSFISVKVNPTLDKYSDYTQVIYVEVNVKNNTGQTAYLTNNDYDVYGPNDTMVDKISSSLYPTLMENLGYIRNGGVAAGHFIFKFVGYGNYNMEFTNGNEKITVKIPVLENVEHNTGA